MRVTDIYSIAYNIYAMVLLISSYSIPMAVSKVVSGKLALKQYREAHKVFRCALLYVLIVGAVASLFTFFCASLLVPDSQMNAVPVLKVLAPAIFLSGFLGVLRGYFQAHSTMIPTSISQIIEQVLNAIVSIGAALLFIWLFARGDEDGVPVFGAMGSAAGIVVGVAAGLVFMILIYRQNRTYFHKHYKEDVSPADSSYKEIFKVMFLMITPVILRHLRVQYQRHHRPDDLHGRDGLQGCGRQDGGRPLRRICHKIHDADQCAGGALQLHIHGDDPGGFRRLYGEDYEECNEQVKQSIHLTMMISIPSAVGLAVLAYPVMQLLFPQKDTIDLAVHLLQMGCITVVFYCLSTVTNGVLQGIGKVNVRCETRRWLCCSMCCCCPGFCSLPI